MNGALQGAAKCADKVTSGKRSGIIVRFLFPIALLEVALWSPLPVGVLCGVCALWYISWNWWRTADSARTLGLELRGLMQASWLLGITLAVSVVVLAAAYFSGSLHRLWGLQHPWYAVAAYVCWAFVQEFMLQCFCLRMLRTMVSQASSLILSGVVFAVAHLPNPSLTFVTFFAGVGFTAIYARKRNLYVVALIHAVLGLTLAVSAPEAWFHELRVGRDFLRAPSTIAAGIPPTR
jgi:membrane protease YdiL (CAAX protease family)